MDILHAAECGNLAVVKQLISEDKSVLHSCRHRDYRNRSFNVDGSAIHYACRSGHYSVVKYLLEQDQTIIDQYDGEMWRPLHYACSNGHLNIVRLLVKYNADVTVRDSFLHQTPIEFAMYRQFDDIVRFLDPNNEYKQPSFDCRSDLKVTPVFRQNSTLFLGRFILNDRHIKQIESFRGNLQSNDIELRNVIDAELSNLQVRIIMTHDFKKHINKTIELSSDNENDNDSFLRSSSTATREHIMILPEDN